MLDHRKLLVSFLALLAGFAVFSAAAFAEDKAPTTQVDEASLKPGNVSFDAAKAGSLEVARATTGHLLVKPLINGKDVGWFIFDTGAGITCIDKAIAKDMNLPDMGSITANGMGGDKATKVRQAESVQLGPVTLNDTGLLELDLKPFQLFMGKPIAGVIGYEVFGAAIYEIDLAGARVTVHDPAAFKLENEAEWSDMKLISRRPYVKGALEGNEEGLFVLDIGSNSGLIVHSPTVNKFKLLDGRKTTKSLAGGVGGMQSVQVGQLKEVQVAGKKLADVETTFSTAKSGGMASNDSQATIGVALLKQFKLFVDYTHSRIAFHQ